MGERVQRSGRLGLASPAEAACAVSDPDSEAYGRYLTPVEIRQQLGPSPEQVVKVTAWLQGQGLSVAHTTDDALQKAFGASSTPFDFGGGGTSADVPSPGTSSGRFPRRCPPR